MARYGTARYGNARYDEPDRPAAEQQTMKRTIKNSLRRLPGREQVARVRGYVTGVTNNPHLTGQNLTVNPPLADLTQLADDAEEGIDNYDAVLALVEMRRTQRDEGLKALRDGAKDLIAYVQNVSKGDAEIIQSANMEVMELPAPVGELAAPDKLIIKTNGIDGLLKLRWPTVDGVRSWVVERTTNLNDPAAWEQVGLPTKASFNDMGLTAGTKYWYRVAAVGAAGMGPWSPVAWKMAI